MRFDPLDTKKRELFFCFFLFGSWFIIPHWIWKANKSGTFDRVGKCFPFLLIPQSSHDHLSTFPPPFCWPIFTYISSEFEILFQRENLKWRIYALPIGNSKVWRQFKSSGSDLLVYSSRISSARVYLSSSQNGCYEDNIETHLQLPTQHTHTKRDVTCIDPAGLKQTEVDDGSKSLSIA